MKNFLYANGIAVAALLFSIYQFNDNKNGERDQEVKRKIATYDSDLRVSAEKIAHIESDIEWLKKLTAQLMPKVPISVLIKSTPEQIERMRKYFPKEHFQFTVAPIVSTDGNVKFDATGVAEMKIQINAKTERAPASVGNRK